MNNAMQAVVSERDKLKSEVETWRKADVLQAAAEEFA